MEEYLDPVGYECAAKMSTGSVSALEVLMFYT
jgi:hypothetical protein